MNDLISILDNSLLQGLSYGIAVIGILISFRILRYPDLTADGSFLIGSCLFSALLSHGIHWSWAACIGTFGGSMAGCFTALIHTKFGVNRLLSGILTSMVCYSFAFRILAGKSAVSISDHQTFFEYGHQMDLFAKENLLGLNLGSLSISGIIAMAISVSVYILLKSELGLFLRATGENPTFIERLGRKPQHYQIIGLGLSNALIAFSGVIITARQQFSNVNMGLGIIITLVASLIIGEEVLKHLNFNPISKLSARILSPIMGSFIYFLLYILILRASIRNWIPIEIKPTDLKMMSAIIVIVMVAIRWHHEKQPEEILPL